EVAFADAVGDDEEVSQPTTTAQLIAHLQRTGAAVVERQQDTPPWCRKIDCANELRVDRGSGHGVEVPPEGRPAELERQDTRAPEPGVQGIVCDVVVGERRDGALRHGAQRDSGRPACQVLWRDPSASTATHLRNPTP